MRLPVVVSCVLLAAVTPALSDEPINFPRIAAQLSRAQLMESVGALAGFDGRQSGIPGGEAAAAYIVRRLPNAVLQSFPVNTVTIGAPVQVEIFSGAQSKSLRNGIDFLPILSGASAPGLSGSVVFVGYGISDPAGGLDEYHNVSVTGKIVLFLRGQPKAYSGRISHADKERMARAKGAVGYLAVTGPILTPYEQRRGMSTEPMAFYDGQTKAPLPGLWITPAVADFLLEPMPLTLETFQRDMEGSVDTRSGETGSRITLAMEQYHVTGAAANVLGFWSGSDPELHNETIILGAHYDHFGIQGGIVFPGADDNASGTAVILEVARVLSASGIRTKRSILFIAFAGEEQGLLGSKFYTMHPLAPLHLTRSMINVDHAGAGDGKITVGLSRIEKSQAQMAAERAGLRDEIELFGLFPGGDHVPFSEAGVSTAAIVSSGRHPDFHRPSDTPDRVNPEILFSVARYTLSLLLRLANAQP
ncbi:MAG: M28 family peptidase [Nitrospirota bacterium]